MRVPGYCVECRRFVYVLANDYAVALATARGGVVEGICAECERKQDEQRRERSRRRGSSSN